MPDALPRPTTHQPPSANDTETICGFPRQDVEALAAELSALRREVRNELSEADFVHLRKLERWGRSCAALGYGTAWVFPNVVSAALIALGKTTRWTVMAHPISHKGYDAVPGIPERYTSRRFARGWRRAVDWLDWIAPDAWHQEHDILHHFRLGESADPDLVEHNLSWLRELRVPIAVRRAIAYALISSWKWIYYAPTTMMEAQLARADAAPDAPHSVMVPEQWDPRHPRGRELWSRCYLPYAGVNFVAIPLAYSPLGPLAVFNVAANQLLAEWIANVHSFIIIGPNHAGDDMYRFDKPGRGKAEFFLRQIIGSVNYQTGGDVRDWLQGWLNYQIEHHLFPNMTLLEYQKLQPRVKALCEKYDVPYVQEPVWRRARKTIDVMVGKATMRRPPRPTTS